MERRFESCPPHSEPAYLPSEVRLSLYRLPVVAAYDPLLSASQVARMYGTGITTVVELVAEKTLATLDDGALIAAGRIDVPVIRKSWARSLQKPTGGSTRVLDPPEGHELHPAMVAAADFVAALQAGDADSAYALTSVVGRGEMNATETLEAWYQLVGGKPDDRAGIGTSIYSLAPLEAVAARVLAHTPKFPRAVERPTPARMITPLPLVEEGGDWKLDLELMAKVDSWISYLTEPMP